MILSVTALLVLAGFFASRWLSRLISEPVGELVAGTTRVAAGEFDQPIPTQRSDELGELARSFNEMAKGLKQRDLIKDTFGKFVDPKIAEGFLADPAALRLGGEVRVQSVLFSDLAGFTTLSEKIGPEELVKLLNRHLGASADIVASEHGIIDKFIGDAVVAFWGPPITQDHALRACRAALKMVAVTRSLADECKALGCEPFHLRIGIATGEVLVGNIGSPSKFNYTVMGDTANLGSRLEGVNTLYETQILVDRSTADAVTSQLVVRPVDIVRVKGRREPVELFEVIAEQSAADEQIWNWVAGYAEALSLYRQRRWAAAKDGFEELAERFPQDEVAKRMASRCISYLLEPPAQNWDGVFNLDSK